MKTLTNEQLFIAVIESGSFKSAAERLSTDPSSVSRRISSLEKRLGVKLIERSTKRSSPTETGHQYYLGLKKLLDEQVALESQISGMVNRPSGLLKVAAPHDFGNHFVLPVLNQLTQEYPELSVEMLLGSQFEDLKSQGIDVAVRIGKLPDSSLICRRIGDVPRVLVASRGYIEKRGLPTTPNDLDCHNFIFYKKPLSNASIDIGDTKISVRGNFTVNSVSAVKELVLSGQGIHLGPEWAFKAELDSGELVELLPQEALHRFPAHAIYVSRTYVPAKVRIFIDRLIQRYRSKDFK